MGVNRVSEQIATISAPLGGGRLMATALGARDLDRSLALYVGAIGMRLLRRKDYAKGRFTVAFVGFGEAPVPRRLSSPITEASTITISGRHSDSW
jgi:catechol 2,3-dioxygenase-like lactoylglutathione lyase family enzyme